MHGWYIFFHNKPCMQVVLHFMSCVLLFFLSSRASHHHYHYYWKPKFPCVPGNYFYKFLLLPQIKGSQENANPLCRFCQLMAKLDFSSELKKSWFVSSILGHCNFLVINLIFKVFGRLYRKFYLGIQINLGIWFWDKVCQISLIPYMLLQVLSSHVACDRNI
jgi:hypothetical protein